MIGLQRISVVFFPWSSWFCIAWSKAKKLICQNSDSIPDCDIFFHCSWSFLFPDQLSYFFILSRSRIINCHPMSCPDVRWWPHVYKFSLPNEAIQTAWEFTYVFMTYGGKGRNVTTYITLDVVSKAILMDFRTTCSFSRPLILFPAITTSALHTLTSQNTLDETCKSKLSTTVLHYKKTS